MLALYETGMGVTKFQSICLRKSGEMCSESASDAKEDLQNLSQQSSGKRLKRQAQNCQWQSPQTKGQLINWKTCKAREKTGIKEIISHILF